MNTDIMIKEIGAYCREFRKHNLGLSQVEFSRITNLNVKSVWAFEYGKANNIKYLIYYYQLANKEGRKIFSENIFDLI